MPDPITRWKFAGLVAFALLCDLAVYLYTESEGLALLCAMLLGGAAVLLLHQGQPRD